MYLDALAIGAQRCQEVVNTDVKRMSCARKTANNDVFAPSESGANEGDEPRD